MTATPLELVAGAARVELLPPIGGAIASFTWRGRDALRPMPDDAHASGNVRLAACYPLVPYSNRIRDARLRFRGDDFGLARNFGDHPHAIHGVGWQREWHVDESSPLRAVLSYEHEARGDDVRAWPWPFRATQAFDITDAARGARLVLTLTIVNTGATPFPFGLGWHPFFPRDATTTLCFGADAVWLNDATMLPVERVPAAGPWSFAAPRDPGTAPIDNVFTAFAGTATLDAPARALTTTMSADSACDRLVVYAPVGRDFVAIEPVTHETDAFNRAERGERATGLRVLRPGAAFSCTMRIDVTRRD